MPVTIVREVTLYQYAELSDRAKDRAREWWFSGPFGVDLSYSLEPIAAAAHLLGFHTEEKEFHYSIGDRGDYFAFTGTYSYRKGAVKAIRAKFGGDDGKELSDIAKRLQNLQRAHFYQCYGTVSATRSGNTETSLDCDGYYNTTRADDEDFRDIVHAFCEWARALLKQEYEYQTSEEYIADLMEANEYTFDEEGRRTN